MLHLVTRTGRRLLSYWHLLTRRDRVTSEIDAEMRFHIDMETERLAKEHGLPLEEARRRALVSFGGVEKYKEAGHDVHGLRWLDALLLDSRFSLRMLLKHRGLTMVAGFAMAVAIAVGTTAFETISGMLDSVLPVSRRRSPRPVAVRSGGDRQRRGAVDARIRRARGRN